MTDEQKRTEELLRVQECLEFAYWNPGENYPKPKNCDYQEFINRQAEIRRRIEGPSVGREFVKKQAALFRTSYFNPENRIPQEGSRQRHAEDVLVGILRKAGVKVEE